MEDVESFRLRARTWLSQNMPTKDPSVGSAGGPDSDDLGKRARELQRRLFEGGFAGICFPSEYGGLGLTRAHQIAFTEEARPYKMPILFNVPTLSIMAPTLLDFGTEPQKSRHIPAILRGDELWVQFLSEPSGGSDLASLLTSATRDGDELILNGSKIWSSGAFRADYALCLVRTNWQVPKHRGLTCLIVKIHQPRLVLRRIKMVNGSDEFCQEFFDDLAVPVENVVGEIDDGWTVATRLLFHERAAVGGASQYTSGPITLSTGRRRDLTQLARSMNVADDPRIRQLVAQAWIDDVVSSQVAHRVSSAIGAGKLATPAGSFPRLLQAGARARREDIALEIAGSTAVAWGADCGAVARGVGVEYLMRQAGSLGGGSSEMARNIISERMLGMPREPAADRDLPFDQVPRGPASGSRKAG